MNDARLRTLIPDDHLCDEKSNLLEFVVKMYKYFFRKMKRRVSRLIITLRDLVSFELISHSSGSKIYQILQPLKIKFLFPAIN